MPLIVPDYQTAYRIYALDHTDQISVIEIPTRSAQGTISNMVDAFQNVMASTITKGFKISLNVRGTPTIIPPTSGAAQNEIGWRVNFVDDTTGDEQHYVIPGADMSLLPSGSETLDTVTPGSPGAELVDWLEEFGRSYNGNTITIASIMINYG